MRYFQGQKISSVSFIRSETAANLCHTKTEKQCVQTSRRSTVRSILMTQNMQRKSFVKIWEWICKQILKYPNILKSWDKNWSELTTFFEYPQEIRKIIYTTNAVESYHRMVRKFTKSKATFPTDDSIRKIIFMSVILNTNKTIGKKTSHNPYMQDYARFFA